MFDAVQSGAIDLHSTRRAFRAYGHFCGPLGFLTAGHHALSLLESGWVGAQERHKAPTPGSDESSSMWRVSTLNAASCCCARDGQPGEKSPAAGDFLQLLATYSGAGAPEDLLQISGLN